MTAAVYRETPSLSVPLSQNTAPVLEFSCLYTHDVKKKAKKWQDGFLRYHTFNKRVMVYDVPRNLVGDMHWTGEQSVQEGDELTLERNGTLVEVGDSVGQVDTDLSELRKSTKKTIKPGVSTNPARMASVPVARLNMAQQRPNALPRSNLQPKHRSLNALLGTPKGPIGKASLPQKSPFEERQQVMDLENEEWEDGRPPKRARVDSTPAWTVTRTLNMIKPAKYKEPTRARTPVATKQKENVLQPGQQKLGTREVVELSDDDHTGQDPLPLISDAALTSSLPHKEPRKVQRRPAGASSPVIRAQRVTNKGQTTASMAERYNETRMQPGFSKRAVDVPEQADLSDDESDLPLATAQSRQQPKLRSSPPPERSSSRSSRQLRLAAVAPKKKTLLCQDQLKNKPKRFSFTNTDIAAESFFNATNSDQELAKPALGKIRETYQERLARIDRKKGSTSSVQLQSAKKRLAKPIEIPSDHSSSSEEDENQIDPHARPATSHEMSAMELRRLDEMMLPPALATHPPTSRTLSPEPRPPATEVQSRKQAGPAKQSSRPLRRIVSEVQKSTSKPKRPPGAPVRYTPTPSPTKSRDPTPAANPDTRPTTPSLPDPKPPVAPQRQQKPKRPLSKSVSLNVTANGTSESQGPWTREAFDLFVWRPPGWDEEKWCLRHEAG